MGKEITSVRWLTSPRANTKAGLARLAPQLRNSPRAGADEPRHQAGAGNLLTANSGTARLTVLCVLRAGGD